MNYQLKHFDTPLLTFAVIDDYDVPTVEIISINEETKTLLPLDLELSNEGLSRWIKRRNVPKNRAYVQNLLNKLGLSINRPMNIIQVSLGLSLNDCYWIVEDGFEGQFDDYNLYDNKFNRALGLIAFTGYGSNNRMSLVSCPEFTTNGALPKCWRRDKGVVKLYKGGTVGASNTGNEPYSEFYASEIGKILGVNIIDYRLSKWKNIICSTCEIFTSKEISYLPVGNVVCSGGIKAVYAYYEKLGPEFVKAFKEMLVFDAIICNTDRHFGNFGFLVDSHSNTIIAPAPLFDHGNSLFNLAGRDDLQSYESLKEYADRMLPAVYDNFIQTAKDALTPELHQGLRRLSNFKLKKHSHYNLDDSRLKKIEKIVQERAKSILEG